MLKNYLLLFNVLFAWSSASAMDSATPTTSLLPHILFEDLDSNNTVTLVTNDNKYGFKVDKERVKISQTLKSILEECALPENKIALPEALQDHNHLCRFFRYLYCNQDQLQLRLNRLDGSSLIAFTCMANHLEAPSMFNPCCTALHTNLIRTICQSNNTTINATLTAIQHIPQDIKILLLNKIKQEDKIHFYWLQHIYKKPGKSSFFVKKEKPHVTQNYFSIDDTAILYIGTNVHGHIDGSRINEIPEYWYMRDQLDLIQFLLLLYAKKQKEQGLSLQLKEYPLLHQAFSGITCQSLIKILNHQ